MIRVVEFVAQMHRPDAVHDQTVTDAVEGAEDHHMTDVFLGQTHLRVVGMEECLEAALRIVGAILHHVAFMENRERLAVFHAIRRADEDGNDGTVADPTWNSLFPSPPYPTYSGNAAGHGMGQATILAQFFGRDDIPQTVTFTSPAAVRSYPGFTAIADEQARSRVYGGIHFAFDNAAGQSAGRNVANYIFRNYLTPKRCDQ